MNEKKKVISLCLEFIEASGIEVESNEVEQKVYTKLYNNQIITDVDLGLTEISFAIAKIDSEKSCQLVEAKLGEKIEDLVMLILTSSVAYSKRIEKAIRRRKQNNSNIKVLMIGKGNVATTQVIGIKSRIQAIYDEIEVPRGKKKTEKVSGCVYSAYLYDIIKIYNELGDELFKKNVRLRVKKDNVGLGKEIKDTLRVNPNQFWFLNNGITIVTNAAIDMSKNGFISLSMKDKDTFSVVNGAQTISAAHDFIYCDGESKEAIEEAKKALVLLKVVSVVQDEKKINEHYVESTESMSERISKALNRQKPIEAEDLAYYSPFVKSINLIYSELLSNDVNDFDNRFFGIVRRGENEGDSENNYEHSLTLIARAIMASGYKENSEWKYRPWKAVNTYNAEILKMDEKDLKHSELFKTIASGNREVFLENYQYVNLAIFLHKYYAEVKNEIDISGYKNRGKIGIVKESGTWYFISFFFEYLMENNTEKKLQASCIDDFNEYISKTDFIDIISFFFRIMDDDKKEFKLKDLRQESTYLQMAREVKKHKRECNVYKDKVQRLYVEYEEGDVLEYKDYEASISVMKDNFILKRGSKIELALSDNCSSTIRELREQNIDCIDENGVLTKNIEFDDLSLAAKFVEGRRLVKGYKNWIKSEPEKM